MSREIHARQATKKRKKESRLSSFLLFFSLCFSWFVGAGLKLLECVTEPGSSRLSPLSCCASCQWAELPISPLPLPLGVWALEQCVASLLSSCVWLPLLWRPPSFICVSLSPISISGALSGYLEFLWGDWILSFLSPYLSAAVPQMSSLSVIGCLWKPLGFEELCAFMCVSAHVHVCLCVCVCVCVCVYICGRGGDLSHPVFSFPPSPFPPFLCLLPFPDKTPPVEQSRSERRKENLSFISLSFCRALRSLFLIFLSSWLALGLVWNFSILVPEFWYLRRPNSIVFYSLIWEIWKFFSTKHFFI